MRVPVVSRRLRWRFYGGDFWFVGNRSAISSLRDTPRSLWRYFSSRQVPEESLIHTVLCNDPDLRVDDDSRRFGI